MVSTEWVLDLVFTDCQLSERRVRLWRRETYDFRPGESSASKRSTAILPFGEDISKARYAFLLLKLEGALKSGRFFRRGERGRLSQRRSGFAGGN